jgi:hypothetical protein
MQTAATWWCNLIGITDLNSVNIAVGIVGGVSFLIPVLIAWMIFWGLLAAAIPR